jgi:hypothetical protein
MNKKDSATWKMRNDALSRIVGPPNTRLLQLQTEM